MIVLFTEQEGGAWKRHNGEHLGEAAAVGFVFGDRLIVEDRVLAKHGLPALRYAPLPEPMPQ